MPSSRRVQQDPDTSELHFALGSLFRRRGEYERAVRVHEHLLQRADLPRSERDRAQHELAQDFPQGRASSTAPRPPSTRSRARPSTPSRGWRCWRCTSARATGAPPSRWRSSSSAAAPARSRRASRTTGASSPSRPTPPSTPTPASRRWRRRSPPRRTPRARSSSLGKGQAARGDHAEAYRVWSLLMQLQPAAFNLVARRYAATADALGRASAARERLQGLYEQVPSMDLLTAIASLSGEAGGPLVLAHLREHPTLAAAQAVLEPRVVAGAEQALDAVSTRAVPRRGAQRGPAAAPLPCAACGFEAEHYFWQCPGCLGWDTYPPQRLEDV